METKETAVEDHLQHIITQRTLAPSIHTVWPQIHEQIPSKIRKVLTTVYNEPLDRIVIDHSNKHHKENIGQFSERLIVKFKTQFKESPPYTILRLAELLQNPKSYYNTAPKFLRAVEVITSVSSMIKDFEMAPLNAENEATAVDYTTEDITVADATQVSAMDITIDDVSLSNISGNGDSEMIVTEETGSVVLSEINWLTEEDIEEIESENYLISEEIVEGNHNQEEIPLEKTGNAEVLECEEEYTKL